MIKKLNIKTKMLATFGSIAAVITLGLGIVNYQLSKNALQSEAFSNLSNNVTLLYNAIQDSVRDSIINYLRSAAEKNRDIVRYYYDREKAGQLTEGEARATASAVLLSQKIGMSGYLYCVDSSAVFRVHPSRELIGVNGGQYEFVQLQTNEKEGYLEYDWKNPGEETERPKALYMAYFKPWDWIISATCYRSEFNVLINIRNYVDLVSSVDLGDGGYSYIINTGGDILLHPKLSNTNLLNSQDGQGYYFMRDICSNKNGTTVYSWKNPGEKAFRTAVAMYRYLPELDWIVVCKVYEDAIDRPINSLGVIDIVIILLSLALITVIALLFSNSLLRLVNSVNSKLDNINSGQEVADLTKRIDAVTSDEIGRIAGGINRLIEGLNADMLRVSAISETIQASSRDAHSITENSIKKSIDSIRESVARIDRQTESAAGGVEELTSSLEEMSRNIDGIIGNMGRQASAVEEAASSIEEMVRNIENSSVISNKTRDISGSLNSVATEGGTAVRRASSSIKEVAEFSQQILKMLSLITNIAKQTNLLAMNASIEAAHAGDAGKGFAIVADEIRRMSEDTNKNAKEIGEVVNSIVSRIGDSVKLAEKAAVGLDMIMAYSTQTVQVVSQLNITMDEQNNGAKEVLRATQELVQITEEVQLSMKEQKTATTDFYNALISIRDLSSDNKNDIKSHLQGLNGLIQSIEEIRGILRKNEETIQSLSGLLNKYKLDRGPREQTGLKLIE